MDTFPNHNANDFDAFKRQLTIIYYALSGSMLLAYVVLVLLVPKQTGTAGIENIQIFRIAIPLLNMLLVGMGSVVFRYKVKAATTAESAPEKFADYRTGWLIRSALLESLGMMNAIAYFILRDMTFEIMFFLVLLLYIVSAYPNPEKVKREMGLS